MIGPSTLSFPQKNLAKFAVESAPVSASSSGNGEPLETVSFDARGTAPEQGQLIPDPSTYPNPKPFAPADPLKTTWGFGQRENLYNSQIETAVKDTWPHQDFPLDPLTFKALVAAESAFRKDAVSPTGAVGLVQITGGTARAYGVKVSPPPDQRRSPEIALPAGVKILADKLAVINSPNPNKEYAAPVAEFYEKVGKPSASQMETLSLAGYNGGGSTVLRAMSYAIADDVDPREFSNLVAADKPMEETPLYKAIVDTFGPKFAPGKYHEMGAYPGRIHSIQARAFKPLQGTRVMVDPGHGGGDAGAQGPHGGKEAAVNLAVSLKLRDKLESLGADVRMTRETDRKVSHPGATQQEELRARVKLANQWPAQVYVSVHSNSAANASAHGTETYHSRNASRASRQLAAAVQPEMVKATGFRDRGVKSANFHVIKNTSMPAILVETGFISNAVEEKHLLDPAVQDRMAQAITNGVEKVFGQTTGATQPEAELGRITEPPVELFAS